MKYFKRIRKCIYLFFKCMGVLTLSVYAYHAVSGALGEQKWVSDTL